MPEAHEYPQPPMPGKAKQPRTIRKVVDFSLAAWNTAAVHTLFTVTGGMIAEARLYARTVAEVTSGGSATIKVGTLSDDNVFYADEAIADRGSDADDIWIAAALEAPVVADADLPGKIATTDDVTYTIGTAALLTGQVEFVLEFVPLGNVRVALGDGSAP